MRTVYAQKNKKIILGRQGEDRAVRVVWPGIVSDWSSLYGDGSFQLSVRRFGDENAYPVVVEVNGDDVCFTVTSAETAIAGNGKCELTYIANGTIAKSATWETVVLNSLTGQAPSEPPEEPAKSWFTSIQGQIGNLADLATASKDTLVAAINEAAKSGGGSAAAYVLTLSTDEADAQANSDAVTAAIAEHGHVVLKPGKYPVKPGIVIDSGKLDMNGAHFYTVDYKSSTPLVYMKGESPEICNGELEGSYDLADDEEGYEFFENESLIFPYGVNDAYIHHMELHNNWGYCISTGTETEKTTHYVGTATKITSNDFEFTTDAIEIPEGYKYVTASGQVGYNRIISTRNVYYHFFDEGGAELRVSNAVPKARIAIPNGAKTVKINTRLDNADFLAYNVYFTNYRESLTVSDCKFRNFHSLGLAGFEGPTNIVGCSFIESGKPRSDANGTGRATTGGVDIEDTPCPEFYMANCYSRDCAELLMFGGYKGVVTNCIGDKIGAYRGWHLGISNCNISKLYTMGAYIRVSVDGVHADGVDINEENWKDVHGDISTNTTSPGLQCFDSFLVKMTDSNTGGGEVCGVVNGRIKCSSEIGLRLNHGFSTDKGSRLVIDTTIPVGGRPDLYGILGATGDIYGLESNTAVVPNGHTIHDSTFTIADVKSGYMTETAMSGAFENCVFNLTGATYFKNSNATCSNPIDLTFTNCIINNADYNLFNFVPAAGGVVTFKNCTIADESKLFNGDASIMTVNILSGGEGGVDVDASLSVEGAAADAKAVGTALAEKQPKGDYLTQNELQDATNAALSQAKESGEFDGADGITPNIGDNGNWYLGATDTGKPSRGEKGDTPSLAGYATEDYVNNHHDTTKQDALTAGENITIVDNVISAAGGGGGGGITSTLIASHTFTSSDEGAVSYEVTNLPADIDDYIAFVAVLHYPNGFTADKWVAMNINGNRVSQITGGFNGEKYKELFGTANKITGVWRGSYVYNPDSDWRQSVFEINQNYSVSIGHIESISVGSYGQFIYAGASIDIYGVK